MHIGVRGYLGFRVIGVVKEEWNRTCELLFKV